MQAVQGFACDSSLVLEQLCCSSGAHDWSGCVQYQLPCQTMEPDGSRQAYQEQMAFGAVWVSRAA